MITLGALLLLSHLRTRAVRHQRGVLLGAAAGILFGVSDVGHKGAHRARCRATCWRSSVPDPVAVVASVAAFYASARGLQVGEGLSVIALTSVAANVSPSWAGSSCSATRWAATCSRSSHAAWRSPW